MSRTDPQVHDVRAAADPGRGRHRRELRLKRLFDVLVAGVLLVLVLPVLLVAAALIRGTSRGPVLFRQERLGMNRRRFVMLKLRTMEDGCSDDAHRAFVSDLLSGAAVKVQGLYKLQGDSRVTRVGSLLRRTSIDELPQLWNVLRGQMSLVGPRPCLPWEAEMFPAWARRRFDALPGVTGLWQVSGRNRLTMTEGLALDVRYVDSRDLVLDLRILARTVTAVLGHGAR
jgi:lipopolysaccharide/colanic/teichoic acid biosynthesis glycosyltransferase